MGAKDDIYGVFPKAIFAYGDLRPKAAELMARITRLVQKAQRMDVILWLHDAQVDAVVHIGWY